MTFGDTATIGALAGGFVVPWRSSYDTAFVVAAQVTVSWLSAATVDEIDGVPGVIGVTPPPPPDAA
jgi:hypothetical protein